MGLMSSSQSLTHPSLSINPNPNPPWLNERKRLGDVTCESMREKEPRAEMKMKKDLEMARAQGFGYKTPIIPALEENS
ncbi:hypothetical protein Tco_0164981 [Tanacetum coccineum]